jgi:preprotein translocase subunit SecF
MGEGEQKKDYDDSKVVETSEKEEEQIIIEKDKEGVRDDPFENESEEAKEDPVEEEPEESAEEKKVEEIHEVEKKVEEEKEPEKEPEKKEEPKEEVKEEKKEEKIKEEKIKEEKIRKPRKPLLPLIKDFYDTKYKTLLIIPFVVLLLSLILIGAQIAITGDFVRKDVSLKGGLTLTIPSDQAIDVEELELYLGLELPQSDISVRSLKSAGKQVGIIIDGADVESDDILTALEPKIGKLDKDDYSVEFMGSSLGESFFKEIIKAIYVSFLFMGIVVFWYFGTDLKLKSVATFLTLLVGILMFFGNTSLIKDIIAYIIGIVIIVLYIKTSAPSFMVIFNVFCDLIVSLAIVNLMGIKLSTAGIAAFLMIIGYSVDTNILLSTKLIKRKDGSISERLFNAMKTGLTMTLTTLVAVLVALIFTQSDVIRQIMVILLVGLLVDMLYTWIQNVGILRLYLEKGRSKDE